jgi:Lrp/AsnC family transcriptional regulator, leucine-responsive regulatory protein
LREETDSIQANGNPSRPLDAFDRRILRCLTEDTRQTHADIGAKVGLSAPAVHQRIARLRADGVIEASVARLSGRRVGKPLVAFVHVDAEGWGKSQRMMKLDRFPEVEEIHSVAGDTSVIIKVRVADPAALEHLLAQIYQLKGVRGTQTFIALATYLERPVQADVTGVWPEIEMPPE